MIVLLAAVGLTSSTIIAAHAVVVARSLAQLRSARRHGGVGRTSSTLTGTTV